ncbi:RDD family protein [Simiduia agarivorans]|uniref:RDD family domain-containing protein n=1 Tax=Simiduia agarivorans (strain DSM 21679 / JCM 13881 / BCRC 17597 / SA1) TaxID=1117647 RepID=K4KNN0_SIMAS|nr:RDD family protein [Simiduia agarivorans]AFU99840.1 RDD family domain-containing protein [Simiduia agarivorans SA1 = DSM 21679]
MNPWQLLELEPTDDARAIKRAYAKKLKLTRPDDDPKGFQALNEAYQRALQLAKRQAAIQTADGPVAAPPNEPATDAGSATNGEASPDTDAKENNASAPVGNTDPETPPRGALTASERAQADADRRAAERDAHARAEAAVAAARDQALNETLQAALALVQGPHCNDRKRWSFVGQSQWILDPQYNQRLSRGLIAMVVDRLDPLDPSAKQAAISDDVLRYLNQLFEWSDQPRALAQLLSEKQFDQLKQRLSVLSDQPLLKAGQWQQGKKFSVRGQAVPRLPEYVLAGMWVRFWALALDLFLVYMFLSFTYVPLARHVFTEMSASPEFYAVLMVIPGYFLMAWIMESGPLQATPAKHLLNLRITNRRFERIGLLHGVARSLAFLFNCCLWKLGYFINLFLKGELIHDRLSRTYVINLGRSLDEQFLNDCRDSMQGWFRRR